MSLRQVASAVVAEARQTARTLGGVQCISRSSPELIDAETAADDALEGSHRHGLVSMHGNYYLATVRMAPFLMTALLADQNEPVPFQYPGNFLCAQNGKVRAHGKDTSRSFAPVAGLISEGSNHSSSASLALRTASSSVSPAEAHPGSSGKTADHRLLCGSNSTSNRSFMLYKDTGTPHHSQAQPNHSPFAFAVKMA